ncbi:NAD(P)H-dependent glycerol-3-phosphate dehydrogenase [Candidatus Liberibacter brunswickensis]|uniref:NAD(P)H-dependent glycerol-3-phosphate dehydrogenase n=1 Tax=Candidatus Liberibacter brunswickensis TaxID=1968796 RepID=UPI002FE0726D
MKNHLKICVIGAGAFGTSLSTIIASRGNSDVTLLGRKASIMQRIKDTRVNEKALPGINLSPLLNFSSDHTILQEADIVLFATSSKGYGDALNFYKNWLKDCVQIIICSKGFEYHSGILLSSYSEQVLPSYSISVLSGPGFARDIAQGFPVRAVLSSKDIETSRFLSQILSYNSFQLCCSDDRIGVQIGGALKNVIAIASGIVKGRGCGESACATVMVQGLSEMIKLAEAMGGRSDTILGLSGIGDLILTSTSKQSRNFCFGVSLGKGEKHTFDQMQLVEGGIAASRVINISTKMGLHLPIFQAISDVMKNKITVDESLNIILNYSS